MAVSLHWAPIDGALLTVGSRQSAINMVWRWVPEAERTPVRRKFVIALVDHIREHHERTGQLSPTPQPDGGKLDALAAVAAAPSAPAESPS